MVYGVGKLIDALFPFEPASREEAKRTGKILHKKLDYNNPHQEEIVIAENRIIGIPDRIEWNKIKELKTFFNQNRMGVAYQSGMAQANIYCYIFRIPTFQVDLYDIINDELIEGKTQIANHDKAEQDIELAIRILRGQND